MTKVTLRDASPLKDRDHYRERTQLDTACAWQYRERARNLLAEAGYEDGLDLVFDIPSTMPDEAPALARMMVEQYSQVGINVEIVEHEDRAAYSEMVREKRIKDAAAFDSSPSSTYRVLMEKIHSTNGRLSINASIRSSVMTLPGFSCTAPHGTGPLAKP